MASEGRNPVASPNLFVITGGPGAGKTAVLRELEKLGFTCYPEVARQIIQEQVRNSGTALPWHDREAYTQIMLQRSLESYLRHVPGPRPAFSDRGIPDTFSYARLIGLRDRRLLQTLKKACADYRYSPAVFVAPPWKEIYETDSERRQDFAEAERTFDQIVEVYRDCGYKLLELPKLSPVERAHFIRKASAVEG